MKYNHNQGFYISIIIVTLSLPVKAERSVDWSKGLLLVYFYRISHFDPASHKKSVYAVIKYLSVTMKFINQGN